MLAFKFLNLFMGMRSWLESGRTYTRPALLVQAVLWSVIAFRSCNESKSEEPVNKQRAETGAKATECIDEM